ncbi:PAS domain S-box-containing protein [Rhodopirellula rubra]|uniref:histidine kinase n=1 Tax=Aporhodopirellula rubra TaxID=980271 RepID=A0A7W5H9A4_9BACT|nr:PAS domain S-box protein [Aporhodopirellula rubra]MBB3210338.1 PAS domain S-box-containing protein [Aporhodopirellula rubra]
MAIYTAIAIQLASTMSVEAVGNSLERQCVFVASDIERFVAQRTFTTRLLSQADLLEVDNVEAIHRYLVEVNEADPVFSDLYVLDLEGTSITSSRIKDDAYENAVREIASGNFDLINKCASAKQGDVFFSELVSLPAGNGLLLATPITDDSNEIVIRVLIAEIQIEQVQEIVAIFSDEVLGNKFVYIVNKSGNVVTTGDQSGVPLLPFSDFVANPTLLDRLSGSGGIGTLFYDDSHGDKVVAGFADIAKFGGWASLDWSIIAVAPVDVILAPTRRMRNWLLAVGVVVTLVALGIALFLSQSVTRSMSELGIAAEKMQRGIYDTQLPISGIHEIRQIALAFNSMASAIASRKRKLAEANAHLSDLYENAPDMLYSVDAKSACITSCNQAFADTFNCTKDELLGRSVFELYHPNSRDMAQRTFSTFLETGAVHNAELQLNLPNGSVMDVLLNVSAIRDQQGNVSQSRSSLRDISRLKQLERSLVASEQRLRTILETEPECVKLTNQAVELLEINAAGLAMIEAETTGEVIGKSMLPLLDSDYRADFIELTERVFGGESVMLELEFTTLKGNRRWVETHASPLRDTDGAVTAMLSVTRDITDRKNAAIEVQMQRDRAQQYLDVAGVVIGVLDTEGEIISINRKGCELLGYTEAELVGKNWFDTCLPDDGVSELLAVFSQIMRGDISEIEYYENLIQTKDGEHRLCAFNNTILREGGDEITGVLFSALDITERKHAEESLLRANASMDKAQSQARLGSWEMNVLTQQVSWSAELYRIFNQDPQLGPMDVRDFTELVHPDDRPLFTQTYSEVLGTGKPTTLHFRRHPQLGPACNLYCRIEQLAYGPDGSPLTLSGTTQDITELKQAEDAVRESERRIRLILDNLVAMVGLFDLDGRLVEVNQLPLDMAGLTREDVLDLHMADSYWYNYSADEQATIRDYLRRAAEGEVVECEVHPRLSDGTLLVVFARFGPIYDSDGNIVQVVGSAYDITDRKRAETMLRSSEERLRMAMTAAEMGFWDWNLSSNLVIWSEGSERLWGMEPNSFTGTLAEIQSCIHPDELPRLGVDTQIARDNRQTCIHDFRVIWPDGSTHWIESLGRFEYDDAGQPTRMLGVFRDVSDQKAAQIALKESFDRLQRILDGVFIFVGLLDVNGVLVEANRAPLEAAGIEKSDVIGCVTADTYWVSHSVETQREFCEGVARAAAGETVRQDITLRVADGELIVADWMLSPLFDASGRVVEIVSCAVDVTDRIRAKLELRSCSEITSGFHAGRT